MKQGDVIKPLGGTLSSEQTRPPSHFTDSTLIKAMTSIHRLVEDPGLKKVLSETNGLGTDRTRDEIIEKNVRDGFLVREGRKILAGPKSRILLPLMQDELKDPVMTAKWEIALKRIAQGQIQSGQFATMLQQAVSIYTNHALQTPFDPAALSTLVKENEKKTVAPLEGQGTTCPACSRGVLKTRMTGGGKRFLGCSEFFNKENPCSYIKQEPRAAIEPLEGHGTPCPSCQDGTLLTRMSKQGNRFLGCSGFSSKTCNYIAKDNKTYA